MSLRRDKRNKTKQADSDQNAPTATASEDDLPRSLPAEVTELIEQLRAERDEAVEAKMRSLADFKNFQRRSVENEARALESGKSRVLRALLPVLDQFELARQQDAEQMTVEQFAAGMSMVQDEMQMALHACGLSTINPTPGSEFNPQHHEAMMHQPSEEHPPGSVVNVFQTGYKLDDFVLRPAKVVTASSDDQCADGGDA